MRHTCASVTSALATLLLAVSPGAAVENGQEDGNDHPAVGFVMGTRSDPCQYFNQAIGCAGVLISPDLFLTTADCSTAIEDSIASGFIDTGWVIFDTHPFVPNVYPPTFDCTKMIRIESIATNPVYLNDPDKNEGNVGVFTLETPQNSTTPVSLPVENRLKKLPHKPEGLTVVAFGRLADQGEPSGFDLETLTRRFSTAKFIGLSPELQDVELSEGGFPEQACIEDLLGRGATTFVGSTNEIVSLALPSFTGCARRTNYQRLDVPSVRSFLDDFVTLP